MFPVVWWFSVDHGFSPLLLRNPDFVASKDLIMARLFISRQTLYISLQLKPHCVPLKSSKSIHHKI